MERFYHLIIIMFHHPQASALKGKYFQLLFNKNERQVYGNDFAGLCKLHRAI